MNAVRRTADYFKIFDFPILLIAETQAGRLGSTYDDGQSALPVCTEVNGRALVAGTFGPQHAFTARAAAQQKAVSWLVGERACFRNGAPGGLRGQRIGCVAAGVAIQIMNCLAERAGARREGTEQKLRQPHPHWGISYVAGPAKCTGCGMVDAECSIAAAAQAAQRQRSMDRNTNGARETVQVCPCVRK